MTDRELLELAAKAIGIDIFFSDEWHDKGSCYTGTLSHPAAWNPLKDDGDALRLAIKLNMNIHASRTESTVTMGSWIQCNETCYTEDYGTATRRAIVRAAALLGETR